MRWELLGLLGLLVAVAGCDDDASFPGGTGGSGAAAGSGGTAATGGAGGTGGSGGSAGSGGSVPPNCGDGNLDPPLEECDDGNTTDGDGCDSACQLEPVGQSCGNTLDPGEKCDDGNLINGDGCNPTCNFLTQVTELATGVPGNILTSDGTYLYAYGGQSSNCQIHRADLAQCTQSNCTFTAFVGAGGCGTPADGPGSSAVIGGGGSGLTFGVGRLFFSDSHTIRSVDLNSTNLDVTTLAGDPARCGELDGVGANAVMSDIRGMTFYNGLLYFVDANMATLRSLDAGTGQVTTLAGQSPNDNSGTGFDCNTNLCCGSTATAVDGMGVAAIMNSPRYITGDNSGNIYIIDTNGSAIRQYDTGSTLLSTIISGTGYTDGVGNAVLMDRPRGITSDGTSLYFGEQNENTVRQVELATATTSTFVGVRGCAGPANLNGESGGDGTQDWSGSCNNSAVANKPQFAVGVISMAFDFGTSSIYAIATGGRLLRIE